MPTLHILRKKHFSFFLFLIILDIFCFFGFGFPNIYLFPPTFTRFCDGLSGISEQKGMPGFNCLKTKSEF